MICILKFRYKKPGVKPPRVLFCIDLFQQQVINGLEVNLPFRTHVERIAGIIIIGRGLKLQVVKVIVTGFWNDPYARRQLDGGVEV